MNRRDQIKVQVKGFLTPTFFMDGPDGKRLNGLDPEAFEMVRQGFACPECLAIFSAYTITCPICHHSRDVAADVKQAPDLWEQHIRERNAPWTAEDKPVPVNPMAAMAEVASDPDVEQIPLRKLRNTRKKVR